MATYTTAESEALTAQATTIRKRAERFQKAIAKQDWSEASASLDDLEFFIALFRQVNGMPKVRN